MKLHFNRIHFVSRFIPAAIAVFTFALPSLGAQAPARPVDQEIQRAVETVIRSDPAFNGSNIEVGVTSGTVSLTGTVPSLTIRQHAIDKAEAVKGVRSVGASLTVAGESLADQEIREDVSFALEMTVPKAVDSLDVQVKDGNVVVSGEVGSWAAKRMALSTARNVRGVRSLEDGIKVRSETHEMAQLEDSVRRRLDNSADVDAEAITVDAGEDKLLLKGRVRSASEKTEAIRLAQSAAGMDVDASGLEVEWTDPVESPRRPAYRGDEAIRESLESNLRYASIEPLDGISFKVDNGVVVLTGRVHTSAQSLQAEREALHTAGVVRVQNDIVVDPSDKKSDEEIALAARRRIERDALLSDEEIQVEVKSGIVHLTGSVDSDSQKQYATDLLSGHTGVVAIANNLETPATTPKNDEDLKGAVESQFFWSVLVDGGDIEVDAKEGVVTLTGTVDSPREYNAAMDNAFDAGAVHVENKLQISDERIKDEDYPSIQDRSSWFSWYYGG